MVLDNTLQAYTPGSDIAAAFQPNQINWGRTGNDILIGYNTVASLPGETTLDVLIGDIEIPLLKDPFPRNWHNEFVLGDWRQSYYARGNPFVLGLNDVAVIVDFEPVFDSIQLNGQASDYQTFGFSLGSAVWRKQEVAPDFFVPDIVAIILGTSLDLNASYINYTGSAPLAPSLPSARQIGTSGYDIGFGITTDSREQVYVAGGTSGDIGGPNQGNRDIWFSKYDEKGEEIWRQQIGSDNFDFLFGIGVDAQENVYLAGSTQGDLDGKGTFSAENKISDAWVAKFDKDGNPLWIKQFGNSDYFVHNAYALNVDSEGNVDISGVSVKFTPQGSTLPNQADAWVAKFDTNGNQQWFKQLVGNDPFAFEESYAIALDKNRNAYTAGFTTDLLGGNYGGLYDGWVAKYDENGEKLWATNIGSSDYDWAWGVDTDSKGNVYVTGWTLGDLGGTNAGAFDAWLAKFDTNGNQQWIKQFGTNGDDEAFAVRIDQDDNIYVTGYTDGTFTGSTNSGGYDGWVIKFDDQGDQKWVKQFGSAGTEQAYDITIGGNDNVYITGVTDGSLGTINSGSFDAWVVNLNARSGDIQGFTGTGQKSNAPQERGLRIISNDQSGQELALAAPIASLETPPILNADTIPQLSDIFLTQTITANLQTILNSGQNKDLQSLLGAATLNPYANTSANSLLPQPNEVVLPPANSDQLFLFPTPI